MVFVKTIPKQIVVRGKIYKLVEKVYFMEKNMAVTYTKHPSLNLDPKYAKVACAIRQYTLVRGHPFYVVYKRIVYTPFAKRRAEAFKREARRSLE
jgi:hypothetical protein